MATCVWQHFTALLKHDWKTTNCTYLMYIHLQNYHHNHNNKHTHHSSKFSCVPSNPSFLFLPVPWLPTFPPQPQATTNLLSLTRCFHFLDFRVSGIPQWIIYLVWLLSLRITIWRLVCVVLYISSLFFKKKKDFIYLFSERGEGRERERGREISIGCH